MNRPFYIVSRLPMNRVLELQPSKGPVRIRNYVPNRQSQQWIFDQSKTIRSVQEKALSLEIENQGKSNNLKTESTNSRWYQLFRYNNANIVNEKGKVLDVHSALDQENRQVIMWNKHNGLNQQWDIVYAD